MSVSTVDLPRSPDSARSARAFLAANTTHLAPTQLADATLMVSELVTNAVRHGTGAIWLRVDQREDTLRVTVSDEGNVAISPSPTPGAHGGWGLRIVQELADDWGVLAGSTRVWFQLDQPPRRL